MLRAAGAAGLGVLSGFGAVGVYGARSINDQRKRWFTDNYHLTPETLRLPYKHVDMRTEDGVKLAGWYIEQTIGGKASRDIVLCCNPYNHHKSTLLGIARKLWDNGYSVLLFDMRSHAPDGPVPQTIGYLEKRDGEAALAWLLANKPEDSQVALLGASMGGAVALMLAAQGKEDVIACCTDCAFASLKDVVRTALIAQFPLLTPTPAAPAHAVDAVLECVCMANRAIYGYDPAEVGPGTQGQVDRIQVPLLVMHSEADTVVPLSHGQEIHSRAGTPEEQKQFYVAEKLEHIEYYFHDEKDYTRRIVNFLDAAFETSRQQQQR